MSRKLRNEEKNVLHFNEEEKEEEDKLKLMKEQIHAPIVWERLGTGIRIEDVKENNFETVLHLINRDFIRDDILCKTSKLYDDRESVESFLTQCLFQLIDTSSIMAVDEALEPEEIAGATLLRVIDKYDFGRAFSRTALVKGSPQQRCVGIKNALNRKVDLYEEFDCDIYLRIYAVCVKPKYRRKGIGFNMMQCSFNVARAMHIPVVMGIFDSSPLQKCAKMLGMQCMTEINYLDWLDRDGNLIFDEPGAGNYTCALYAGKVPDEPIPEPSKSLTNVGTQVEKKSKNAKKTKRK